MKINKKSDSCNCNDVNKKVTKMKKNTKKIKQKNNDNDRNEDNNKKVNV